MWNLWKFGKVRYVKIVNCDFWNVKSFCPGQIRTIQDIQSNPVYPLNSLDHRRPQGGWIGGVKQDPPRKIILKIPIKLNPTWPHPPKKAHQSVGSWLRKMSQSSLTLTLDFMKSYNLPWLYPHSNKVPDSIIDISQFQKLILDIVLKMVNLQFFVDNILKNTFIHFFIVIRVLFRYKYFNLLII